MQVPKEIEKIIQKFRESGFEAYIVGGCVRDFLQGKKPKDWDIATSARPEQIQKIFPKSFYSNKFFTVTIQTDSQTPELKEVEATTYRKEAKYSDKRHPDEVKFAKTIQEDLSRRDFTVNAIAVELKDGKSKEKYGLIDPFSGQKDLEKKIIRTAGKPKDRFSEDALRLMRAVRLAAVLGFEIEPETAKAISESASLIKDISKERIRDELVKIIMSERAAEGIELLRKLGLLKHIIPELEENYGIGQNKHHIYDCYQHALLSLKYAAEKGFNRHVRLAALFHDIAKPRTKQGEGPDSTFYNHEVVGAKMTRQILTRLRFSKKEVEKIAKLVRYHLFYYNVDEVSESSVRRLVRQVGHENIDELLQVRMSDRIGSGVPKAEPYKLRHLRYIIERVSRDPISVRMLKISGNEVMKILGVHPGPKIGQVLDVLLGIVLESPEKNKKDILKKEAKELGKLSEKELAAKAEKARQEREALETKQDQMTKKKYWVT